MAFAMKQRDIAPEHRSSHDTRRMEKLGIRDANVAKGKLEVKTDEYGNEYYQKYYDEDPLMVGVGI